MIRASIDGKVIDFKTREEYLEYIKTLDFNVGHNISLAEFPDEGKAVDDLMVNISDYLVQTGSTRKRNFAEIKDILNDHLDAAREGVYELAGEQGSRLCDFLESSSVQYQNLMNGYDENIKNDEAEIEQLKTRLAELDYRILNYKDNKVKISMFQDYIKYLGTIATKNVSEKIEKEKQAKAAEKVRSGGVSDFFDEYETAINTIAKSLGLNPYKVQSALSNIEDISKRKANTLTDIIRQFNSAFEK